MNRFSSQIKYSLFFMVVYLVWCAFSVRDVWGTEWVLLGKTRYGAFYFDRLSIKDVSDTVKSVDTKLVFSREGRRKEVAWGKEQRWPAQKIKQLTKLSYRIESHEFDCRKKKHHFVMSAEYDAHGTLLERHVFPRGVFLPVTSHTLEDELWHIVCGERECGACKKLSP